MVELLAQQSVLRTHLRKPKLEQAQVATSFSESGPESGVGTGSAGMSRHENGPQRDRA